MTDNQDPENELHGLLCKRCGAGIVDDEHLKLHNLESGDVVKVTLKEEIKIVAIAEIQEEISEPEEGYMCEFVEIRQDGEEVTGRYTDQIGEKRGVPHSKMNEDVEIVKKSSEDNHKVIVDDREVTGTVHINEIDDADYVQIDQFEKLSEAKEEYADAEVLE